MRTFMVLLLSVATLVLGACGGGSDGQNSQGPKPSSTVADAEAARIAALYRYARVLGSIALANLTEVDIGERRAGTTACTGGGSVEYTDTTPTAGAAPEALIAFDRCVEDVGVIDGFVDVRQSLIRLQPDGFGDFNFSWNADLSVDGYDLSFVSVTGRTFLLPDGSLRVETRNGADNEAVLTAPNGQFVYLDDAKLNIGYDPSNGRVNFGTSVFRMVDPLDSNRGASVTFGDFLAPVTEAVSVFSIGTPISGGLTYVRSFDPTATDLEGRGATQNGLLDLTIDALPPSRSFAGDAGQYAWALILGSPLLTLPAGEPE